MKLFPITLAIGLATASTLAFASHHGAPPADAAKPGMGMGDGMMAMDKMSPEQHHKMMDEMFAQMDANHDGSVTKSEFTAHHMKMMGSQPRPMAPATAPAPEAKPDADHKH